jgi:hypothetical protein
MTKYDQIDKQLVHEEQLLEQQLADGEITVQQYNQDLAALEREARNAYFEEDIFEE